MAGQKTGRRYPEMDIAGKFPDAVHKWNSGIGRPGRRTVSD